MPTSPRRSSTASASGSIRCRRPTNPPETAFVDANGVVFDSTIPYDMRFFEALDAMVQAEPWLERDRAMIDPLKTIGIERGKPFAPDAETQAILAATRSEAKAWLDAQVRHAPALLRRRALVLPVTEEMHQSVMNDWKHAGFLSGRRPRPRLHARLLQRQAPRRVPVLSADRQGTRTASRSTASSAYRLRVPANARSRSTGR